MCKGIYRCTLIWALWLGFALPGLAAATDAKPGKSWQERRLLQPSASQLKQEHLGQVFIYDGLEHGQVQAAMDQHFNRIENMMFTRIYHLPPSGSGPVTVEDDGCE